MKPKYFVLVISFVAFAVNIVAHDSIYSRKSFFLVPQFSYQQETNWAGGIAYGYYFKSTDIKHISSISGSTVYTLNNQFLFNITPKIYSKNKKWYFYTNFNLKKYPDFYYGIGNQSKNLKVGYISRGISLNFQPQYYLNKNFAVGAILNYKSENLTTDSAVNFLENSIYNQFGNDGWSKFNVVSTGLTSTFDSRDNHFYPQKGLFLKLMISSSSKSLGSSFSFSEMNFDSRYYLNLGNNHLLCFQGYYSGIYSKNGVPFQLLPTIGGRDFLRGFRQNMYKDNSMFLLQTEYRMPIYKRLKGAVFCGAGDVFNSEKASFEKLKIAYGAGLRYRLNDARVHLRFDVAKNNYGDKLQFYITATEAF